MKFLPGAKVSKRVMIYTIGHQGGWVPQCFLSHVLEFTAHVQIPVHPGIPWSKGLGQGTSFAPKEFYL